MKKELSLKEKIDQFIRYFPKITKEESDYIESIIKWDEETKMAFIMAKRMFEDDET